MGGSEGSPLLCKEGRWEVEKGPSLCMRLPLLTSILSRAGERRHEWAATDHRRSQTNRRPFCAPFQGSDRPKTD